MHLPDVGIMVFRKETRVQRVSEYPGRSPSLCRSIQILRAPSLEQVIRRVVVTEEELFVSKVHACRMCVSFSAKES